ncbi:Fungalysin metallopeptidase-domain-containing protein [Syncephalis fuscata]|nr:Fungalysin metallopeptidase-domain-containing protein [Syncephalis fuscata]
MKLTIRLFMLLLAIATIVNITLAKRINVPLIQPGPTPTYAMSATSPGILCSQKFLGTPTNLKEVALNYARSRLNATSCSLTIKNSYTQVVKGIELTNGDIAVHVDTHGNVIAFSDGLYHGADTLKRQMPVVAFKALADYIKKPLNIVDIKETVADCGRNKGQRFALKGVSFTKDSVIAQQAYIHTKDEQLRAVWEFFVNMEGNYFHAHVAADGKCIVSLTDWTSAASYKALKWSEKDFNSTAITNLFYVTNVLHDIFYRYGFDEAAGNFQQENFDKGGLGNDPVVVNAQDPESFDDAYFTALPDGQIGTLSIYLWDKTTPKRDGAFMNDIIIHEYSHGVSSRLTGGSSNGDCLAWGEGNGMNEGWSDFFAIAFMMKSTDTRNTQKTLAEYGNLKSLRLHPYSTDKSINPTTYGLVFTSVWYSAHNIGEIWANILYEMYWNLVDKYGFNSNVYSADITKGNTLAIKLVLSGLKLQPCHPTFVSARDAIIQADQQLTKGTNKCEIWAAFTKRGVGFKALGSVGFDTKVLEDFTMPIECAKK